MNWDRVKCLKCGSVEDYSITLKSDQRVCRCNVCKTFLGCKPHDRIDESNHIMPFGKHKGGAVSKINDYRYLEWVLENVKVKGKLKMAIENRAAEIYINQ